MAQSSKKAPAIFFHAGMMRTASTFMQKTVFPELDGIQYIGKKQYAHADRIIQESEAEKILLSFELNNALFYPHLEAFADKYPDAHIILVLRHQQQWITSHYKRGIKNGYHEDFKSYFDVDNDLGRWRHSDLFYYPRLVWLKKTFRQPPLVLFHHELRNSPEKFLNKILEYTGVTAEPVSFKPRHTSYSEKQLRFKRWVNHNTPLRESSGDKESGFRQFINKALRYTLLHTGRLLPENVLENQPLVPETDKQKIKALYESDWEKCLTFAEENNPL